MTDLRRAAQVALDALEHCEREHGIAYVNEIVDLRHALAQRGDGWIACETRMPERFETVVVIGPDEPPAAAYWTGEEWWVPLTDDEIVGVTHWMAIPLLPKPPAQEDTK